MTRRSDPFVVGEWYHCYNSSIERRISFEDPQDYNRFLELLYLANDESPLRRNDIGARRFREIVQIPRGKQLTAIGAFCLMPTHFHLVLKEVEEGGITTFMRKIGTAYTLYFNARYERKGNLFLKPFQSIQVPTNRHQHLVSYVHCSPAALFEPDWKSGPVVDDQFVGERLAAYPYSSLGAYYSASSLTTPLLDAPMRSTTHPSPVRNMLREARLYCTNTDIP